MNTRRGQLRPLEGLWLAAAVVLLVASVGAVDKDKSYTSKLRVVRRFDQCPGERQHLATRDGSTFSQLRCTVCAGCACLLGYFLSAGELLVRLVHGSAGQCLKQR